MKTTNSSLWLAVAIALVAAACAKDTSTPTERAISPSDVGPSADKGSDPSNGNANEGAFTYAVIGDFPYGPVKRAELPHLVDQINADPAVERVLHAGDIKAGSASDCSDAYFQDIRTQFDR